MKTEQLQKIIDSIQLGDFVTYKNNVCKVTSFGRNRTTGKHYFMLDEKILVIEDDWNKLKKV